jgi:phospholipid/cholesterol/gamma-HCH transport system permease protein
MNPPLEPKPSPASRVQWDEHTRGKIDVRLFGRFTFEGGGGLWAELQSKLSAKSHTDIRFDLEGIESMDGGSMALLVQSKWNLQTAGVRCEFSGGTQAVKKILALYEGDASPSPKPPTVRIGDFGQLGNRIVNGLREARHFVGFVGGMILDIGGVIRRPSTGNWRDIWSIMARTGADAVPIVVLINFLMGLFMGFQAAVQLKQFGANIYVADLVGLSITRELGPLMTAIIVVGRSGAAFAAELGTMKVSEEIDALRTMGLGPLRFLVFPRVLALLLVMPALTLLGDLVGILGGLLVGVLSLDLTITGYINQTQRALGLWDVFQGVTKATVFGVTIGLISCAQGLATTGGAEGVGRRTTAAVVTSLFAVIMLDALFTVVFHKLGL